HGIAARKSAIACSQAQNVTARERESGGSVWCCPISKCYWAGSAYLAPSIYQRSWWIWSPIVSFGTVQCPDVRKCDGLVTPSIDDRALVYGNDGRIATGESSVVSDEFKCVNSAH